MPQRYFALGCSYRSPGPSGLGWVAARCGVTAGSVAVMMVAGVIAGRVVLVRRIGQWCVAVLASLAVYVGGAFILTRWRWMTDRAAVVVFGGAAVVFLSGVCLGLVRARRAGRGFFGAPPRLVQRPGLLAAVAGALCARRMVAAAGADGPARPLTRTWAAPWPATCTPPVSAASCGTC